jgi:hypothetical protein
VEAGDRASFRPRSSSSARAPLAAAAPAGVDFVADLLGKTFLRALADGDVEAMLPLCSDPMSFAGQMVRGEDAIRGRLAEVVASSRLLARGRLRIQLLPYAELERRVGPPPPRLRKLPLEGTVVALGRFARGGAVAVLRQVGGRWRVVALTE